MRTTLVAILLSISVAASAQVAQVNVWRSMPGKQALTAEYGEEASAIHAKLGANAVVSFDTQGRMLYALLFENWTQWALFGGKLAQSAEWAAFLGKISATPSAELEDQYLLNTVAAAAGELGPVFQVFIWEPELGRGNDLFQAAVQAKPIHEKAGAQVTVLADEIGRLFYLMSFESWETWGKFSDTPNPEFQSFLAKVNEDAPGRLVQVYTGSSN